MRTFTIPKVERKSPDIAVTSSVDFIKELAPHKSVHFASREGIAQILPQMPQRYVRLIEDGAFSRADTPEKQEALRVQIMREAQKPTTATSRFVTTLHDAFAQHVPFSISPEVIWTIVSQEVAQYVKDHSEEPAIASLFTTTPGEKPKLVVQVDEYVYGSPNNNWLHGISKFRGLLAEKVPSEILGIMTPKLSEATLETEVTHLVSFMDAASKYYEYGMMTCCGIPEFRIEGTDVDWHRLVNSAAQLQTLIPGMNLYFSNLIPILKEIRDVASGNRVNYDFWTSIYKEDGGSGGPYSNGWFNNLYAHLYERDWRTRKSVVTFKTERLYDMSPRAFGGTKLNQFPSNLSVVPFEWEYYDRKYPMTFVGGISGVEVQDGFLTPKLGVTVLEREASNE